MGNKGSYEGPFADVELAAPGPSVVAIDARFVRSQITRIRLAETSSFSKNLVFKNLESNKEFFTGPDRARNVPRCGQEAAREGHDQAEHQQHLLRAPTWELWLARGHSSPRTAVGRIYRHGMRNGFNLDIAPNVDVALVLLICAVLDDDLKHHRLRANKQGDGFAPLTNPYMS